VIEVVTASPVHVGPIATRMRAIDARECSAWGRRPKEALRLGLRGSVVAWTALKHGKPIAMFGVTPLSAIESKGRAWFLATDEACGCARALLTIGPNVIAAMHRRFDRLENWVSVENEAAIRMLGRWRFELGDETMTVRGTEFRPFWKDRRGV
jgi:hypothetical protein